MTAARLQERVSKLEQQASPAQRIVVLYPGDAEPGELPPGACAFRVVYVDPTEGPPDAERRTPQ